jgi:hypothetical protein
VVTFVLHRLRLIIDDLQPEPLEEIVEVDEMYLGGKWANMNKARRAKIREQGEDKIGSKE